LIDLIEACVMLLLEVYSLVILLKELAEQHAQSGGQLSSEDEKIKRCRPAMWLSQDNEEMAWSNMSPNPEGVT
jgi:hypothetical protein